MEGEYGAENREKICTGHWWINMDAIKSSVEELVKKELESANKKFPLFASNHEGAAIIVEEIQEADFELQEVLKLFNEIWNVTRNNSYSERIIKELKKRAISLATESIQVAAMAQKFIDSENSRQLARMEEETGCRE